MLAPLQEIMHYKRIVDERSELRKLQAELQSTKEGAEATRQYHLTSVNHLEEKLKVLSPYSLADIAIIS